jgi:alcohol oxidase
MTAGLYSLRRTMVRVIRTCTGIKVRFTSRGVHLVSATLNTTSFWPRSSRVTAKSRISKVRGLEYSGILYLSYTVLDLTSNNGLSRWQKFISPEGKRQDTAHQYLHPLLQGGKHLNLHVILQTRVIRIIFDENKRASAVECAPSESRQESLGHIKSILARKMVIICSGALGTPPILERSGIGNPSVLQQFAIPVISSLPGVGENYQDHHFMQFPYKISLETQEAKFDFLSNGMRSTPRIGGEHSRSGWNAVDLSSKLRPTATEIGELGPEFQAVWDKEFKNAPEKPLVNMGVVSRYIRTVLCLSYDISHY